MKTTTEDRAYDLGYEDGINGTTLNAGRCDVTERPSYERGFQAGQAERLAQGLPAAATK